MDTVNLGLIVASALCGAIGGLVLGGLIAAVFRRGGRALTFLFAAGGIAVGIAVLPPYLRGPLGPLLEQVAGEEPAEKSQGISAVKELPEVDPELVSRKVSAALADLNDPFFNAVLAKEPNRANNIETQLGLAFRRGGDEALKAEALSQALNVETISLPFYMARATDGDLINAMTFVRDSIVFMSENDPMVCHQWLYGHQSGTQVDYDQYRTVLGPERHTTLKEALAQVVLNSSEILPEFDENVAIDVMFKAQDRAIALLGDAQIGLINGAEVPSSMREAKAACAATADIYGIILADENAVTAWRYFFINDQIL